MLTNGLYAASKNKMIVFLSLVFFLCAPCSGFSQSKEPAVKFGSIDLSHNKLLTSYDPVFADPQLHCTLPGYKVITYTFSLQPKGKDFCGPFATKGDKLTDKEIILLKHLRDEGIEKVQVFFEDIKVIGPDGTTRSMGSVVFTIQPN
jgi:hypothetical protein